MKPNDELLSVRDVTHFYGKRNVLRNISLSVAPDSIVCVFGRSGSGKSTLLNVIAGLIRPTRGDVLMEGHSIARLPPQKRDIGYIFQDTAALFPHLSVEENISFAVQVGGRQSRSGDLNHDLGEILQRTGLSSYRKRSITSLSGGERQRVAIARTLIANPKVMLLDEPLSSLDNSMRREMLDLIAELHKEFGGAYVYVTHDEREAAYLATHLAVIENGGVVQSGTFAAVFDDPISSGVARLLDDWAVIALDVQSANGWARPVLRMLDGLGITAQSIGLGYVEIGYRVSRARVGEKVGGRSVSHVTISGSVLRCWPWYGRWRAKIQASGGVVEAEAGMQLAPGQDVRIYSPSSDWKIWIEKRPEGEQ